jgi:hypothetical protein
MSNKLLPGLTVDSQLHKMKNDIFANTLFQAWLMTERYSHDSAHRYDDAVDCLRTKYNKDFGDPHRYIRTSALQEVQLMRSNLPNWEMFVRSLEANLHRRFCIEAKSLKQELFPQRTNPCLENQM